MPLPGGCADGVARGVGTVLSESLDGVDPHWTPTGQSSRHRTESLETTAKARGG